MNFSHQFNRRASIDTGSCSNALPETLSNDRYLPDPKFSTLDKLPFSSVRMASGQLAAIEKQAKLYFTSNPIISKIVF